MRGLFRSFIYRALPHTLVVQTLPIVPATMQTAIIVSTATFNSVLITAIFVIFGCQMKKSRTTVQIVVFAASVVPKTFAIVTIVACALTKSFMTITIVRPASIVRIAPCARNTYFLRDRRRTKCPVATPFTGTAFANWWRTIRVARFVKKQPKHASA